MSNISGIVKSIQDIMRKDAGVDGDAQRIGQLAWLFFLKIFDDQENELELHNDDYVSPIPEKLRWRKWAADSEGVTGDGMLELINELFKTLKDLNLTAGTNGRGVVVRTVFEDAYNYMKNGTLLRQVANKIQEEIDFTTRKDRHLLGNIYEKILKDLQSAGNAGEYYTPRAVTQFIVEMVNPMLGDKVLDPACGTGGFLTCVIDHLEKTKQIRTAEDKRTLEQCLYRLQFPAKVAKGSVGKYTGRSEGRLDDTP